MTPARLCRAPGARYFRNDVGKNRFDPFARRGVKLRAFGAFNVRSKRERVGRNPRTGVEAKINARRVLTFRLADPDRPV